jgi:hypothetical protein
MLLGIPFNWLLWTFGHWQRFVYLSSTNPVLLHTVENFLPALSGGPWWLSLKKTWPSRPGRQALSQELKVSFCLPFISLWDQDMEWVTAGERPKKTSDGESQNFWKTVTCPSPLSAHSLQFLIPQASITPFLHLLSLSLLSALSFSSEFWAPFIFIESTI